MPRNAAGVNSLPAGNPIVDGTIADAEVMNDTLEDISNELTNSVDRQGRGAMAAPLQLDDIGTAAAPSLTFDGDPDNGIFRTGANAWGLAAGGVALFSFIATQITGAVKLVLQKGLEVTQSVANTAAIIATGNGTGAGVSATGGATNGAGVDGAGVGTGAGLQGTGGAGGGAGVKGTGGAGGPGVHGTAGAGANNGVLGNAGALQAAVEGINTDSGAGGQFSSTTGYGLVAIGNNDRSAFRVVPRAAAPTNANDGDVYYDSTLGKFRGRAAGAWVDLH